MGYAPPSTATEFVVNFGTTGLTGVIGVRIMDNQGNDVLARTTAGIAEYPANSAIYAVTLVTPAIEGQYSVVWDDTVSWAADDLVITSSEVVAETGAPGTDLGPCTGWLSGSDVADCCDVDYGTDASVFDDVAVEAAGLLFEISGRRFSGICSDTVRPCRTTCGCPWQVLSRGHIVWNENLNGNPFGSSWWCDDDTCGCRPVSRVLLAGYVQSVTAVSIDGVVVDSATYRLDSHRWLTRIRDPADPDTPLVWPGCQNMDLADEEEGTFVVSYTYGHNPPVSGQSAARELACELYKQCQGEPCKLPKGTVRLARQGVVMEKTPFTSWGWETGRTSGTGKGWSTGMAAVDAFLNAYNPSGLIRQPIFWSPASVGRFAQGVG
jgi:hypothetical protein